MLEISTIVMLHYNVSEAISCRNSSSYFNHDKKQIIPDLIISVQETVLQQFDHRLRIEGGQDITMNVAKCSRQLEEQHAARLPHTFSQVGVNAEHRDFTRPAVASYSDNVSTVVLLALSF